MARATQLTLALAATEERSRLPAPREEVLEAMALLLLSAMAREEQEQGGGSDDHGE